MGRDARLVEAIGHELRVIDADGVRYLRFDKHIQSTMTLTDHLGSKEDPERLRQILSNVKSVLRKRGRQKTAAAKPQGRLLTARAAARETPLDKLEFLEERIDDCLTIAKLVDQEGLGSVIQHPRRARNEVVWKLGQ